jgi:hypothetical protein
MASDSSQKDFNRPTASLLPDTLDGVRPSTTGHTQPLQDVAEERSISSHQTASRGNVGPVFIGSTVGSLPPDAPHLTRVTAASRFKHARTVRAREFRAVARAADDRESNRTPPA